jgi:NAD(P)-dependent dehydrogenase (short-subunit alcohol dehydrogenase family)
MELDLKGKTALITGASRGIGFGAARVLASEGVNVHLTSRTAADLEAAKKKIADAYKVNVTCHPCDLGAEGAAEKLAREVGDIDFLVNNAGAIPQGTVVSLDEKTWRKAWDLKVWGFINLTREYYGRMAARKSGVIVNVIGAAGERHSSGYIAGSMGNASLMALSRALGADSHKDGIRVVGINPGAIETDRQVVRLQARSEKELGDAKRWRELVTHHPFKRLGTVDEIANMVAVLCSDCSGYTTGCVITIDGGASHQK